MTDTILYFAYGSNLHPPQMHERCPTCTVLQPATLADYRLVFCGHSEHWGGGVASVVTAPGARVEGLLYRMQPADVEKLDVFEACPVVYDRLPVQVTAPGGVVLEAMTYQKRDPQPRPPSIRYFHQIWRSYKAFDLDESLLMGAVDEALEVDPATHSDWRPGLR